MKRLKRGADDDPQRARQRGGPERQAQARTHKADGNGKEMEIAQEPERPLVLHTAMALVLRDEVDGVQLDSHQHMLPVQRA